MRFSVVTLSFNPSFWIGLCIASVADQGVEVEHIVQDPGSTDGTLDRLAGDPRVQLADVAQRVPDVFGRRVDRHFLANRCHRGAPGQLVMARSVTFAALDDSPFSDAFIVPSVEALVRLRGLRLTGARERLQHADAVAFGVGERHVAADPGNVHRLAEHLAAGRSHLLHRRCDVVDRDHDRRILRRPVVLLRIEAAIDHARVLRIIALVAMAFSLFEVPFALPTPSTRRSNEVQQDLDKRAIWR